MTIETTYHVRFVGTIWQGLQCAGERTISANELGESQDERDAVALALRLSTPDFASIDAWDIVKCEREVMVSHSENDVDGWSTTTIRERATQMVAFNNDDEGTWADCMYEESIR